MPLSHSSSIATLASASVRKISNSTSSGPSPSGSCVSSDAAPSEKEAPLSLTGRFSVFSSPTLPLRTAGTTSIEPPAASVLAASLNGVTSQGSACRSANACTRDGINPCTSRTNSISTGCATIVLSITRFIIFSMDQASSPTVEAPTIRPEPFRVWKARRNSINASSSP